MSEQVRQCYICLDTDECNGWVSPCRCSGSLAWVHRGCLLQWIREHESSNPGSTTACSQCLTVFILMPEKGPIVSTLELIDKRIYPLCKMSALMMVGFISFDAACATVGVVSIVHVYGLEHAIAMLNQDFIIENIAQLHYISYALIAVTYVPWEDYVLTALRRASRLPVLGCIFPSDAPSRYKIPPISRSMSRIIVSCVILPSCAKICGQVFFRSIECNVKRFIAGGALYLAVKGIFYMYYQQKLLNRRKCMTILPYQTTVATQTRD